jgi:iron complex transport system ATP-binding protein
VSDEILALEAASVRIEGRTILGPLDLHVRAGQHWVVLGPNGSGKTTLLSLAGARRQPSRGIARVLGERIGRVDVRQLRRRIGHVSQAVADQLRPSIRVLDVVRTGRDGVLESWWLEGGEAEARRALTDVGCDALAGREFGTCSSGERQRVLLARAMLGRHDLLLFDEPAAGLDLSARESLMGAMAALARRGHSPTTLLATHHLEEVPPTVTHAALLRDGALVTAGEARDVLAAEPMSACFGLPVVVDHRDGRWTARAAGGRVSPWAREAR